MLVLLAVISVVGCDSKRRRARREMPTVTAPADRRAFFKDVLAKRLGHPRESRESFTLPRTARPPFVVWLDYSVDWPGAVIVELDGSVALTGPHYDAGADSRKTRHLEREVTLFAPGTHEVLTTIASPAGGYAMIQIVGTLVD